MSLEAFGDEGNVPANGKDTAIYQELAVIYGSFSEWWIKNKRYFSGPNDEQLALQIDRLMSKLCDELAAWEP